MQKSTQEFFKSHFYVRSLSSLYFGYFLLFIYLFWSLLAKEWPVGRLEPTDSQSLIHTRHVKKTWPNTANRPELFKQNEGQRRRRRRRKGGREKSYRASWPLSVHVTPGELILKKKPFYTWFHSHLVFFHHFQQVLFPSPVTPSHPLFPPPAPQPSFTLFI